MTPLKEARVATDVERSIAMGIAQKPVEEEIENISLMLNNGDMVTIDVIDETYEDAGKLRDKLKMAIKEVTEKKIHTRIVPEVKYEDQSKKRNFKLFLSDERMSRKSFDESLLNFDE